MSVLDTILSLEILPDSLLRMGIRAFLKRKLREESQGGEAAQRLRKEEFVKMLRQSPVAEKTRQANQQHYEVPSSFYEMVLGKRLKYSCGFWASDTQGLDQSEEEMLRLVCQRAELKNGQSILELGCGWGSLSLYVAEHYPESSILSVSNSRTQKIYIDQKAREKGFGNLRVETADMNDFSTGERFDRILSVEMLEHMRNYEILFGRIAGWLKPGGLFWAHIFAHEKFAYPYLESDPNDWIARYFFSGGIMPSRDLFTFFQKDLECMKTWKVSGLHYHKTCEAWLRKMDGHRKPIQAIFQETYGAKNARRFWAYWRIFFMACSELFRNGAGDEWMVMHYLFRKK